MPQFGPTKKAVLEKNQHRLFIDCSMTSKDHIQII